MFTRATRVVILSTPLGLLLLWAATNAAMWKAALGVALLFIGAGLAVCPRLGLSKTALLPYPLTEQYYLNETRFFGGAIALTALLVSVSDAKRLSDFGVMLLPILGSMFLANVVRLINSPSMWRQLVPSCVVTLGIGSTGVVALFSSMDAPRWFVWAPLNGALVGLTVALVRRRVYERRGSTVVGSATPHR